MRNVKCNVGVRMSGALLSYLPSRPDQEDDGMLTLALIHTPCQREVAHTMDHASDCTVRCDFVMYIPMSMMLLLNYINRH